MKPARSELPVEGDKVIAPFAQHEATVSENKWNSGNLVLIIGVSLFLLVVGAVAGFYVLRYINDPYRTLADFPVTTYLDNYHDLVGSRYKAVFQVEADLGWKDGAGRLMLFSTVNDPRPIAVLIPVAVAKDIIFAKGQSYIAEIEVKEGGLIYANSCQKN